MTVSLGLHQAQEANAAVAAVSRMGIVSTRARQDPCCKVGMTLLCWLRGLYGDCDPGPGVGQGRREGHGRMLWPAVPVGAGSSPEGQKPFY